MRRRIRHIFHCSCTKLTAVVVSIDVLFILFFAAISWAQQNPPVLQGIVKGPIELTAAEVLTSLGFLLTVNATFIGVIWKQLNNGVADLKTKAGENFNLIQGINDWRIGMSDKIHEVADDAAEKAMLASAESARKAAIRATKETHDEILNKIERVSKSVTDGVESCTNKISSLPCMAGKVDPCEWDGKERRKPEE
jgi:hypothetical protein